MKKLTTLAVLFCFSIQLSAQRKLEEKWVTDTVLRAPESVRYDGAAGVFYITNIGDFNKEGTGFISKMDDQGRIIEREWIKGLTAPKGMGQRGNLLYVAEHKAVAIVNVQKGLLVRRIPIEGAVMLNDVTVDRSGAVYVSDTRAGRVHRIQDGKPELYLDDVANANGLLAVGDYLYILAGDKLLKADRDKNLTTVATGIEGGADGIERVNANEFIVTGWEGTVYIVQADGSKQLLMDTRNDQANAADLWYDGETQMVYIPVMSKNKLAAYKLK